MMEVESYVTKAHLRRSAILDFIKCAAHAGLPLETEALDACAVSSARYCRGPTAEVLCTISEELEQISLKIGGVNSAKSEELCLREGRAIVASGTQRAEGPVAPGQHRHHTRLLPRGALLLGEQQLPEAHREDIESLADKLEAGGALPMKETLRCAEQVPRRRLFFFSVCCDAPRHAACAVR